MAKFLKYIGFLVVVLALWQTAGDVFVKDVSTDVGKLVYTRDVAQYQQDKDCITTPQLSFSSEAELAGASGSLQTLTTSRVQRTNLAEYIFSVKNWAHKIARYDSACLTRREKLFDATAYYRCQPVCEYYIFTLRRILI